jgi:hypothetical protein
LKSQAGLQFSHQALKAPVNVGIQTLRVAMFPLVTILHIRQLASS